MKKILLVGKDSCFSENLFFLFKLAGFDPVLATNLEQAINLIEIKPNFRLLIIAISQLKDGSAACFGFLKNINRQIKILLMDNEFQNGQKNINVEDILILENIKICSSDIIIEEVKNILHD